jgi:hypothetical protein
MSCLCTRTSVASSLVATARAAAVQATAPKTCHTLGTLTSQPTATVHEHSLALRIGVGYGEDHCFLRGWHVERTG